MEIDIRNDTVATSIRVAARNTNYQNCEIIERAAPENMVRIKDTDSGTALCLKGKEHADNLIKGIQKAIELGWVV